MPAEGVSPRAGTQNGALVLFDLTSSYVEGVTCPLAKIGYSRDGKRHAARQLWAFDGCARLPGVGLGVGGYFAGKWSRTRCAHHPDSGSSDRSIELRVGRSVAPIHDPPCTAAQLRPLRGTQRRRSICASVSAARGPSASSGNG